MVCLITVITGGSLGIGRAVAKAFIAKKYQVIVISRHTPKYLDCLYRKADVRDYRKIKSIFAQIHHRHGKIDVLVNCAGIAGPKKPFKTTNIKKWRETTDINFIGTVNCTHAVLPYLSYKGRIINMAGGGVGGNGIKSLHSAYTSSKFAVVGFTEALSHEGIRINAVAPGPVPTRLGKKHNITHGSPEKAVDLILYLARTKSRRLTGKLLSAIWDDYSTFNEPRVDLYTLRRVRK